MGILEGENGISIDDESVDEILDEGGAPSGGAGSHTWGHDTAVEEEVIQNFTDGSGTGIVIGTADAEQLELEAGEYWELPTVETNIGDRVITLNKYGSGDGEPTIEYKTGDTEGNCDADTYHSYDIFLTSTGWVKIKLSRAA